MTRSEGLRNKYYISLKCSR